MKSATHQFIEDAIAGGWRPKGYFKSWETPQFVSITDINVILFNGIRNNRWSYSTLLLDSLAWQAVGKTQGWPSDITAVEDRKRVVRMPQWQYNWHRLIDHLADGKTIEDALTAIAV